ncbi:MAG: OadG family protein [Candidatus Zixiibacteriota bacterium]
MFHLENVTANHGFLISIGGILLVFFGLVLINIAVVVMNHFFNRKDKSKTEKEPEKAAKKEPAFEEEKPKEIPPEHIAVIFAAVELYRRLHFDIPKGGLSIRRSNESYNSWKMGQMYGQRS